MSMRARHSDGRGAALTSVQRPLVTGHVFTVQRVWHRPVAQIAAVSLVPDHDEITHRSHTQNATHAQIPDREEISSL